MKRVLTLIAAICLPLVMFAQTQEQLDEQKRKQKEEEEKALYETIDKEIERYTSMLNLEDWQIFRIDSIMTYNLRAMMDEIETLQKGKVSNTNAYIQAQDKWYEATYQAFMQNFTPEQQAKYLKSGAARAKKARDKRAQDIENKKKK